MRFHYVKASVSKAIVAVCILLLATGLAVAQQVNLTAAPSSITLPDGQSVPMWGYSCGAVVTGSAATCAKLNPATAGWSPVVITVPTGQNLQINLTNSLNFNNGNSVPTSLVIVGQLGGGLGTTATTVPARHTTSKLLRGRLRATTLARSTTRRRRPHACSRSRPKWRLELLRR